ncbi:MAG TPA: hypothetical protein VFV50_03530, partial [Bdellovibrionales bacterium]|nr:hypothetical protein [Bdellovibrionales bacterium]
MCQRSKTKVQPALSGPELRGVSRRNYWIFNSKCGPMFEVAKRILLSFSLGLVWAHRLALRQPRAVVCFFAALTVVFGISVSKLKVLFSVQDMVGDGVPAADELASIKERFEDGANSVLLVVPPEGRRGFNEEELCTVRRWYSLVRATETELKNALSTFDVSWPVESADGSIKYRNIIDLDCTEKILRADLARVETYLDHGPWPILHDSRDRLSLVFGFTFRNSEHEKFGSFDPKILVPLRRSVEEELMPKLPGAKFHWVGTADYQWYVFKGFEFSMIVNGAMIAFLMLASRFLYGTWLSGLIYCATLLISGVIIYGAKALAGSEYDLLSSGLFLILGVACLEDFTFLSTQQLKGWSWKKSMRVLLVPSFLTSLLTMIGFASLYTSELGIIRDFGLWCALGAALEWIMLFVALPAVLLVTGKRGIWVDPGKARLRAVIDGLSVRALPRWVSRAALVVFPLAILAFSHIDPNDTLAAIFPKEHPYNHGINELER